MLDRGSVANSDLVSSHRTLCGVTDHLLSGIGQTLSARSVEERSSALSIDHPNLCEPLVSEVSERGPVSDKPLYPGRILSSPVATLYREGLARIGRKKTLHGGQDGIYTSADTLAQPERDPISQAKPESLRNHQGHQPAMPTLSAEHMISIKNGIDTVDSILSKQTTPRTSRSVS